MNYGYADTLLLPVAVTVPAGLQADTLDMKLQAEWLVCKDVCIPESGEFSLRLPAQAATAAHGAVCQRAGRRAAARARRSGHGRRARRCAGGAGHGPA
jgi:DsbC/DsbD-like thiol-disulfide interchange protein